MTNKLCSINMKVNATPMIKLGNQIINISVCVLQGGGKGSECVCRCVSPKLYGESKNIPTYLLNLRYSVLIKY